MPKYLLLIIACLASPHLFAQPGESQFTLFYLSNDIGYDASRLDSAIRKAKSLQQLRQIVRQRITSDRGKIVVLYRKEGKLYRWTKIMGQNAETNSQWIVTGVRDRFAKVFDPDDFPTVLRDTIILIDTLRIIPEFSNPAYPLQEYKIRYTCNQIEDSIAVPVRGNKALLLCRADFKNCTAEPFKASLLNISAASLADFVLFVPSEELLNSWRRMATALKRHLPDADADEQARYLADHIRKEYGKCNTEEISQWLQKR